MITKRRRKGALLLSAMLLTTAALAAPLQTPVSADTAAAADSTFTDTAGHWAENYIETAAGYGFVNGYYDGSFQPDKSITRAEFAHMLNNALTISASTTVDFWDVSTTDWFYNDIRHALGAGYINGYSSTEFGPDNKITRQEAAVMLGRIIPAAGSTTSITRFWDYQEVGDWATPALKKIVAKGYVSGYNDGAVHPQYNLTRAQAAKIIVDILSNEKIYRGNYTVKSDGTRVENAIYTGTLTISAAVQDGSVTLNNCSFLNTIYVTGGGGNYDTGITIKDCRVADLDIDASDTRTYASGETTVLRTTATSSPTIETGYLKTSGDYGKGFENITIGKGAEVTLIGDFPYVDVEGKGATLKTENGLIDKIYIGKNGYDATIEMDKTSEVAQLTTYGEDTHITGTGLIDRLDACAAGTTYETTPRRVTTGNGADNPNQAASQENAFEITTTPEDGATGVPRNQAVEIIFNAAVHYTGTSNATSSSRLTDTEAAKVISLRSKSTSGTKVDCLITVSADGKKVTLSPPSTVKDSWLAKDTKYYIVVENGKLTDVYGNKNSKYTSSFTTGTNEYDIVFYPKNNATDQSLSTIPMILFKEPIVRYDSNSTAITASFLQNNALIMEKQNSNAVDRQRIDFTADIDASNKVINLRPLETLDEESIYYVTIKAKTLAYQSDGSAIEETTSQFTTMSNSLDNRKATSTGNTTAKVSFKALSAGDVYAIIFKQENLKPQRPTALQIKGASYLAETSLTGHNGRVQVAKDQTASIDFEDLEANTDYYVYMVLYNKDGTPCSVFKEEVTTGKTVPTLAKLDVRCTPSGQTESNVAANLLTDSASSTFYIGTEAYDISIDCKADSTVKNPTYTVKQGTKDVPIQASSKRYVASIPKGTTNPDDITVTVGSTDSEYSTKTYTIKLVRVNPDVSKATIYSKEVSVSQVTDKIIETDDSWDTIAEKVSKNNSSIPPVAITVPTSGAITIKPEIAETVNTKFISYKVYVLNQTGGASRWIPLSPSDASLSSGAIPAGSAAIVRTESAADGFTSMHLGTGTYADMAFYKIEVTSAIENGEASLKQTITKYLVVQYKTE